MKWYEVRNMSGEPLSPIKWYKYCQKWGWNHIWYVITWYSGRRYLRYPPNKVWEVLGKLLKIKNGYK